jgi:hypothetical protein
VKICGIEFKRDDAYEHVVYTKNFKSQYKDFSVTLEKTDTAEYFVYVVTCAGSFYEDHDDLPTIFHSCKSPQEAIKSLRFEVKQEIQETLLRLKRLEEFATFLNTKEN